MHVERFDQRRGIDAQRHPSGIVGARHVLVDESDRVFQCVPEPSLEVLLRDPCTGVRQHSAAEEPRRQRDRVHPQGEARRNACIVQVGRVGRDPPVEITQLLRLFEPGLDGCHTPAGEIDNWWQACDLQKLPKDRATRKHDVAHARFHDGVVRILVVQPGDLPHDIFNVLANRVEIGGGRPLRLPPVTSLLDPLPNPVATLPDQLGEAAVGVLRRRLSPSRVSVRSATTRQCSPAPLDHRNAVSARTHLQRTSLLLAQLVELPVDTLGQLGVESRRPRETQKVTQRSGPKQDERHAELKPPEPGETESGYDVMPSPAVKQSGRRPAE